MPAKNSLIQILFDAKVHLGHKTNRIHPKAKKYIYGSENGVSIIDLTKTVELLEKAKQFLQDLAKDQKKILVVATKKIASPIIEKLSSANAISYVTTKWPAGLLTNFDTVKRNVTKLETLKKEKEDGSWQKLVKHEQMKLQKDLIRLEKFYGGLVELKNMPDAVVIVDAKKEKNALSEARKFHIPVIAMADTNINPDLIEFPIPANDDSASSIECVMTELIRAYSGKEFKSL